MKNEFVPYDIALALFELGFNEQCLMGYTKNKNLVLPQSIVVLSAPLYQQAFRWILEKVEEAHPTQYTLRTVDFNNYILYRNGRLVRGMTQDACLRKLIEIVNQNKDE
jgi:hypothetical protein